MKKGTAAVLAAASTAQSSPEQERMARLLDSFERQQGRAKETGVNSSVLSSGSGRMATASPAKSMAAAAATTQQTSQRQP